MTTYYVSPSGSDANNGLGPDASQSNKPWLTLGKALGASGIASGDTVYIGPGTYRETVTVAMTSATAETSVLGDPGNAQGFKNGSGVLLSAGEVVWTAYTTNDTTAPSASSLCNVAGRDYLTFRYLTFVGGTGHIFDVTNQTSTNLIWRDCVFRNVSTSQSIRGDGAFGTSLAWLIERCLFEVQRTASQINMTNDSGTGSDYDLDVTIRNCLFVGGGSSQAVALVVSGAGAQKAGGIDIYNCFFAHCPALSTSSSSTTIPCTFSNSVCFTSSGTILSAGASGQITEDYNWLHGGATHANVTQGANTVTGNSRAPNWHIGEERLVGAQPRMFMEPKAGSWMLTFGNDATYTTSEDFLGLPRPGGGASATKGIGYLGRGNTFGKGTGTVRTGSNALEITGPGVQDFQLPVDATSTTVSAYVRWDATYAGTKPIMKVLNGGECGVTDATDTATGSSGTWEELSLNFTPARAGVVTVRFQSSDTNGGGKMFVDDFNVT